MVMTHKNKRKFQPKWEGLFVIQMAIYSWCQSTANFWRSTIRDHVNTKPL